MLKLLDCKSKSKWDYSVDYDLEEHISIEISVCLDLHESKQNTDKRRNT